jgi:hypothetical protein
MIEELVNVCQLKLEGYNSKSTKKRPTVTLQRDNLLDNDAGTIIKKWCARKFVTGRLSSVGEHADVEDVVKNNANDKIDKISKYFEERMRVDRMRLVHEAKSNAHRASEDLLFCANALTFLIGKNHAEAVIRRNVLAPINYSE